MATQAWTMPPASWRWFLIDHVYIYFVVSVAAGASTCPTRLHPKPKDMDSFSLLTFIRRHFLVHLQTVMTQQYKAQQSCCR